MIRIVSDTVAALLRLVVGTPPAQWRVCEDPYQLGYWAQPVPNPPQTFPRHPREK